MAKKHLLTFLTLLAPFVAIVIIHQIGHAAMILLCGEKIVGVNTFGLRSMNFNADFGNQLYWLSHVQFKGDMTLPIRAAVATAGMVLVVLLSFLAQVFLLRIRNRLVRKLFWVYSLYAIIGTLPWVLFPLWFLCGHPEWMIPAFDAALFSVYIYPSGWGLGLILAAAAAAVSCQVLLAARSLERTFVRDGERA